MNQSLIIVGAMIAASAVFLVFFIKGLLERQERLGREELQNSIQEFRTEQRNLIKEFGETIFSRLGDFTTSQENAHSRLNDKLFNMNELFSTKIDKFQETFLKNERESEKLSEMRLEKIRNTVEKNLEKMQADNNSKLEEMRKTVDEKLHETLEKRLGESFKHVSERLEMVHKGLGEMKNLANGVGDLKKVLTNVKTKGSLGEYQLENIIVQLLTESQFSRNVKTKVGSAAHVEFAIKLPNTSEDGTPVWLPIDSKFPTSEYEKLKDAHESGDKALLKRQETAFARSIKGFAKDISEKYIDPPNTTEFAIMFLPIEGIYAEVVRNVDLFTELQNTYRVTVAGPATFSALLNSLQMGFKTLAIEKRSSEVWRILGATKHEFSKFGAILEKAEKKLGEAQNVLSQSRTRTRVIERKLKGVESLPEMETKAVLGDSPSEEVSAIE